MALSIRHLRLVQHVAREGTLTAAARTLHLTQSALSHQLAKLEGQLKTPVFVRAAKRMVPTHAGLRLADTADRVLAELAVLEEDLESIARGRSGRIRLTASCYTSYHWLPEVLPEFHRTHPGIEVGLVPEASPRALEALLEGAVDLVLSYQAIPEDTASLDFTPLFSDELVLVVAPDHPLASRSSVEARDFEGETLLVHHDRPDESLFHQAVLEPAGVRPARVTEIRLTEGILGLVAAGSGVAVLTRWTAARDIHAGRVVAVQLGRFGLRRDWNAVTLRTDDPPRYLGDFKSILARGPARLFDSPARAAEWPDAGIVVHGE
ncbi:MAG TPA: LysR family transcriptional regulator [Longimicrobiales bacterium]|nr:LysR family transcriptional regulator [Longimicrobiales bacterium]